MTESLVDVGAVADFPEDTMHPVVVAGEEVLLVHQGGQFYALANVCTHRKYPLHTGELVDGAVKCEWHGAKFDLVSGKPTVPAMKKVRLYQTAVAGDRVLISAQEA